MGPLLSPVLVIMAALYPINCGTLPPLIVSIDNGETLLRPLGSDVILTCSASGSGTINIVWIGPTGNTLTNNTKYTVTSYNINTGKSIFTVFNLSTTDNGTYICRATDGSGSTAQDSISLSAYAGTTGSDMTPSMTTLKQHIEITTPATATHDNATTPNNQTVSERLLSTIVPLIVFIDNGETLLRPLGSDAILTCSASGSGTINIVWIGPTGNTLTNHTKYSVTSYNINTGKSILTIFDLSTTDNGTYICRATDGSGSTAQDSILLSAYGTTGSGMMPSMTTSKQHTEMTTPASSTHDNATTPNNQTVSERLVSTIVPLKVSIDNGKTMLKQVGSDAIIVCSASGPGAINVFWIGPFGNILTNNTKYTVALYNINTGKSTLTMFALSTTDNGSYTCRATDGFGSTSEDSISLTVYGTTSMRPNVTTPKQNMITITPAAATSTHNIVPTTPNNQTVTERLLSTTGATGAGMAPEMTTSKQNMITITPAIATSTHNTVPTTPNNHTVIQRLVSTTVPLTVYIDDGETMFRQLGSDATITCSASGIGNITVVWIGPAWNTLGNNAKYTATSYNTKTGKSTLTIFALSKTDSGSYICLATDGSRSVYDSITLTANEGATVAGKTTEMRTSKQNIIMTTPEISTATHNTISTMPIDQTVIPGLVLTTTPEVSAATHNMIATMPSNQTVTQRLVSTTVPLTVFVDNGETMFRQVGSDAAIMCSASGSGVINLVWIGPTGNALTNNTKYTVTSYNINTGKSALTILALSTTDSGSYTCRATDGSGSTAQDSIILKVQGQTSPEVTSLPQNVTMPSALMSNSTQDMTALPLRNTSESTIGFNAGITSPAMATTQQNIATSEEISAISMNLTTQLPLRTTRRETKSTSEIPEQSNNCCFNENMVIMLQHNVPVVNGYVPFVSVIEQTNGTDVALCDAKVLLKATFRRSNQTVPCQGCTSVPQCGNQMLKIELWMSPTKNGISFHAGDSMTNDGYGGDNNTQENDAEFHFYNYEQRLYGNDKCLNMSRLLFSLPNTSAHWVTIYIGNEFIRVSTPLGDAYELCSNCLFALNGQSDSQGNVNEDIYVGLNRIIHSSYLGDGRGVCGVVISWACPWKT